MIPNNSPKTAFLLRFEDGNIGTQNWLFHGRAAAVAFFEDDLVAARQRGYFAPAEMAFNLEDGLPRKGITKIVAWFDKHGEWPYSSDVWWFLSEVAFVDTSRTQGKGAD